MIGTATMIAAAVNSAMLTSNLPWKFASASGAVAWSESEIITTGIRNSFQFHMKLRMTIVAIAGLASGTRISHRRRHEDAPSIHAVSRKLLGMLRKKPRIQ